MDTYTRRGPRSRGRIMIPGRRLGKTGVKVTPEGPGGEGLLQTFGYEKAACQLILWAIDPVINRLEWTGVHSGTYP